MRNIRFLTLCGLLVGACGCSKKDSGGASFQDQFKKTETHVREFAEQATEAEKQADYTTAFRHYRALSLNPDLTPEQRNAANKSMLEMNAKLREKADQGDKEAEQTLQDYRANK